jgi:branched-chain amino acid transport system permease protein
LSVGAYATWFAATHAVPFAFAVAIGVAAGAATGSIVERVLIRPIYRRPIAQVLVTVGLSLAGVALLQAVWGADARAYPRPEWTGGVASIGGAAVPNSSLLLLGCAAAVLVALRAFLRFTRIGLVIRAGVEDRAMVTALGINVRTAFTLVFAIGGAAAALAGVLAGISFGTVSPAQGTSLLIFGFIVVVIGGLGSVTGTAWAAMAVGLVQVFVNYYASGLGDICVVALLALVLLVRPRGLASLTEGSSA